MKNNNPLLKGGQGRDAEELSASAFCWMASMAWLAAGLLAYVVLKHLSLECLQ
jgi:hypothetical protein